MAYATDADLLARIPSAADVDPTVRAFALADAALLIDDALFGDTSVPAHVYLTAHLLATMLPDWAGGGGSFGGPVTSASAGEISASFDVTHMTGSELATTAWGRMFLRFAPQHFGITG